ncbi:hypothetical protein ONZ51_g5115 [Trametes cubensis]|uniref:Uncharacterized protein n=1 Tax=Trametes cubensis TaxID=1111947 RepID=A0AAD7XCD2_9APHY|nr:hypothetical protein ONZ51_g5115 [Trametes cubensis]
MSDLAFNVWGAIAAVIGTIALVPTFLIWLRTCFPSALLPSLIDTFDKAEVSFKRAVADGVFTNEEEQNQYDVTLGSAYTQILDIQSQVKSRAFRQNAKNWWNGLSGQIVTLCEELTSFQAKLAEKSSKERKRLASESSVADMPLLSNRKGTHNRSSSALHALSGADSCSPELEKNMHSSLGLDRAAGNGSYGFSGQKSEQPTHHLISDTDLQSLLSVALSSSTGDEDIEGQLAARPSEVLLDFEKRLLDSSENDLGPKRSRLGALSRVVKRIYGIRLHGHGKDKGVIFDSSGILPARPYPASACGVVVVTL